MQYVLSRCIYISVIDQIRWNPFSSQDNPIFLRSIIIIECVIHRTNGGVIG
jgi:hypothetical protein